MTRKQKVLLISLLALPTLLRPQTDASRCCGTLVRCPPMHGFEIDNGIGIDCPPPPSTFASPLKAAPGADTNSAAGGQQLRGDPDRR